MNEQEVLERIIRYIGSVTYGKERWFKYNGSWYDRKYCDYIQNEKLLERIIDVLEDDLI